MILTINNDTPYLNNYHFQSLCLLYFPNEKFPENDSSPNKGFFSLFRDGGILCAEVMLETPRGTAKATFNQRDIQFSVPTDDETAAAAVVGNAFLNCGEKLFGFLPPWGFLTGLRPVKRARSYLEKNHSEEQVLRLFQNDYRVSRKKALLSVETAKREISMLSSVNPNACGIYISVPFCPTRCDYCSFVSYSNKKLFDLIPDYVTRVCEDIKKTGAIVKEQGRDAIAIYIGGGTPSFLNECQLNQLLSAVISSFDMQKVREFSFEGGRPDTITEHKLQLIKAFGVDRVNINPQTTSQRVLDAIGRKHTVRQFFDAAELAQKVGFRVANADLIAGLPTDDFETFAKSLDDVIKLGFNNITVHTLSIKNAAEMKNDDGMFDPVGILARDCVDYSQKTLECNGLFPYYLYRQKRTVGNGENTGYARIGTENLYNVLMMEEFSTVFACGAGAITKLVSPDKQHIERIAYPKYPFEYLERIYDKKDMCGIK